MTRGVRWFLASSVVLVALAGCGRSYLQFGEREPWRREAEVACLSSGAVKQGVGLVRIEPIDGPGICGADFPLKVSMFAESPVLGYSEVIRPPGSVPGASRPAQQPRWPASQSTDRPSLSPRYATPSEVAAPMSIERPTTVQTQPYPAQQIDPPRQLGAPPSNLRAPPDWERSAAVPDYDRPSPVRPARAAVVRPHAQPLGPAQPLRPLPRLGQPRPQVAASMPVEIRPAATLTCPIVSALDRWLRDAVQPAAHKWFGQPVAEIKQISAYSCRGMNGQANARISEHAFGNALDIAAFVLADGRRITVKNGWRGSPEEQGFLRDIQGAACDQFTTVLAPGSNAFHYDHMHVDLMRRASGRRICQPGAVDGELVAARARRDPKYAARQAEPPPARRYDPPVAAGADPFAWRGDRRSDPATTGAISAAQTSGRDAAGDDNDWIEDPGPRPPIDWSSERHKIQ